MTTTIGAEALKPNPALKPFEFLIGEWQTTGSHPYFPDAELHGRMVVAWIYGGAFLMIRAEIDHPEFPDGIAIFGSDDQEGAYYQIYFDERGISRKYDVAITDNGIKWWRNDDHFSQRFTMTIEKDQKDQKDRLTTTGEMSRDGGEWEQDLSLTYTKV
jgi:hypothetical protein